MENFTTQESFKLIESIINHRKRKYEENGHFLMLWGILIVLAVVSQYLLGAMGYGQYIGYSWALFMIPAAIYSFVAGFVSGRNKAKQGYATDWSGWLWALAGGLALLTGFLFGSRFGAGFTVMLYLPFCIASLASALAVQHGAWVGLSLLGTMIAYVSTFVSSEWQLLAGGAVAFCVLLIPGVMLFSAHKKRRNV